MKRIILLSSLFTAFTMILFSCNKEIENQETIEPSGVYEYTFAITNQSATETRATFDTDETGLFLKWETGDNLITITNSTGTNAGYSYSQSSVNAENDPVTFTIKSYKPLNKDDMVYCASPYINNPGTNPASVTLSIKSEQVQDGNSYDATALPAVAIPFPISAAITSQNGTNEESSVSFYNLGSVIEFDIFSPTGLFKDEKIQSVVFTTSGDSDYIAGSFSFDLTTVSATDGSKLAISGYTENSVTVSVDEALTVSSTDIDKDHAKVVYMGVAPGTHSGEVKIFTNVATYTYTVPSKDFRRAAVRRFGINLEKSGAREGQPVFEKCTSASPETGKYILVDKDVTVMATGALTNGKKMAVTSVTANADGTITCPDVYVLDITRISDGVYSIANSSGEYIAWKSSTDFQLLNSATSDLAQWSISIGQTGDKQATISNINTPAREIHLSNGDFRPVTSGGTKPLLYSLVENKTLTSISVSGGAREFYQNDEFSYEGLVVTAYFDDESSKVVTPTSVSTPDLSTIGTKEVVVSYVYKNVSKTATYNVTVIARPVFSVTLNDTGTVLTEESAGAGVQLPVRDNVGEYTFCGWCETEVTEVTSSLPAIIPAGHFDLTSNITLYPVYSKTGEVEGSPTYNVTTTLVVDKVYVFGAVKAAASATLANNTTIGAVNFTTTSSWGSYVNLTPDTNGIIESTNVTAACKWTLVSLDAGAAVFKNSEDNYLYVKAGTGASTAGISSSSYTVYLEDASTTCKDAFLMHPASNDTRRLMLNTGSSYGYRVYAVTTSASASMCPYLRFYQETATITTVTVYISTPNA